MSGPMTSEQNRIAYLWHRCVTGFDRRDKNFKKPIPEDIAVKEWQEVLPKRFLQARSGGKAFVLKILKYWENEKQMKD